MRKNKLSYYNYFLILSLVLIAGYSLTSLFFLNRTSSSGEQAATYGSTVEQSNAIIQQTYGMESVAHAYLLTNCKTYYKELLKKKEVLLKDFELLHNHCHKNEVGEHHTHNLEDLLNQRIKSIEHLVFKDSLHNLDNELRKELISSGNELTDSIISTLELIRSESNLKQTENRVHAEEATQNAMFMLSIFGVVMLFIVFISFSKMRKEILINERKTSEINQINVELKSMNENLENFAYVASHDLNEPLRKIRTFGDLIKDEFRNENWNKDLISSHLSRMQGASERMQQLIHDLLSYSRVTRQYEMSDKIDLNEVVKTVLSDLEVSIEELDGAIEIKKLPDNIHADAVQMRQLFQNLLSNALKFHKPDVPPKVVIDTKMVDASQLPIKELREKNNKNYWAISIKDNGIGFNEKYSDKIFAVFQRLHGRSTYDGTGIGLSICKKICENHKGAISAQSEEGEGSIFFVFLPINNNE
ncbi:MAG: ATP-binding protein [Brumimicrobium sp.]